MSNRDNQETEVQVTSEPTLQKDEISGYCATIQGLKSTCDRLSLTVKIQRQKYEILEKKLLGLTNSTTLPELIRNVSSEPKNLTPKTIFSVKTTLGIVKMSKLLEDTFVIIEAPESLLIGKTVNFDSSLFGTPECTAEII